MKFRIRCFEEGTNRELSLPDWIPAKVDTLHDVVRETTWLNTTDEAKAYKCYFTYEAAPLTAAELIHYIESIDYIRTNRDWYEDEDTCND